MQRKYQPCTQGPCAFPWVRGCTRIQRENTSYSVHKHKITNQNIHPYKYHTFQLS